MAGTQFDKEKFLRNRRLFYWFVGWAVIMMIVIIINALWKESPVQTEARQKELQRLVTHQQEQTERDKLIYVYKKDLCHIKLVCAKYGAARQECAVAGNFDNCVNVKIGDKDNNDLQYCLNDGTVNLRQNQDMPNVIWCFAAGLE
jgi:hypothetical protein